MFFVVRSMGPITGEEEGRVKNPPHSPKGQTTSPRVGWSIDMPSVDVHLHLLCETLLKCLVHFVFRDVTLPLVASGFIGHTYTSTKSPMNQMKQVDHAGGNSALEDLFPPL